MMSAEREQKDDRDRNADQPKQDGTHEPSPFKRPPGGDNGSWLERFPGRAGCNAAVKYSLPS
jgi:hypothetical protein